MKTEIQDVDDWSVVAISGHLDTNTSVEAEAVLMSLLDGGKIRVVIDFGSLDYISSAGLRVLLATGKKIKAANGELHLCGLNEAVREVFDISGFSTIFSILDDKSDVIG